MVSRGSSIHHMRRTSNPFMTTSSGIVGINLNEPVAFEAPRIASENNQLSAMQSTNTLKDFMYQTTSQALGDGVPTKERTELSRRMDKSSLQKEIDEKGLVRIKPVDVVAPQDCMLSPEQILPANIDTRSISEARSEHPMYATRYDASNDQWNHSIQHLMLVLCSNREIGAEKAQLKVEIERKGRPNTFTSSFNGFRYRDYGLNTAITKSRICDQLDHS